MATTSCNGIFFVTLCLLSISISSLLTAMAQSSVQRAHAPSRIHRCTSKSFGAVNPGEEKKAAMYETKYFTQTLDHFTYRPEAYATFQQRYLINSTFWGGPGTPIFVYTGNEANIESCVQNTGFVYEVASHFCALVVFVEHRFYGESIPFGGKHEAFKNISTAGYLSTPQALADYATLIVDLKKNLSAEHSPVVVIGGSYGGALATWFRLKYPHLAVGALASSAPIRVFDDNYSPYTFSTIVTNNFKSESESCYGVIKNSWKEMEKYISTKDGFKKLQKNIQDIDEEDIEVLLRQAFAYASIADYPTAANFVAPLPPYPVKKICEAIDHPATGNDTFSRLYDALNIYYNFTGTVKCFRVASDSHDGPFGFALACTENRVENGDDEHSMFPEYKPNATAEIEYCQKELGVRPRRHWISTEFGVKDMKSSLKSFGSNIIFYSGLRDPWSGAGILKSLSKSLVAIVAPKGAHQVDLRFSTKHDPKWLQSIRRTEIQIISKWLDEYYNDQD